MIQDGRSPRSTPLRLGAPALVGLTALEAFARATVPASVLLLSRGATSLAALASASALIATVARGFATSFAVERLLRETFGATLRAAQKLALVDLRAERKIGLVADAARETAMYQATFVPILAAHAILIALTWTALVLSLGPLWALGLTFAAAPLVLALGFGARRIRAQQHIAWNVLGDLAIELRVLVEACVELRAHDREPSFSRALEARAHQLAHAERRANVWSAALAAAASAVVLLSAVTPAGERIGAIVASTTGRRTAEIAILAGAAVYFAIGLGKLLEQRARYAPFRQTLLHFLDAPDAAQLAPETPSTEPSASLENANEPSKSGDSSNIRATLPPLLGAKIELRNVACTHPLAARATPCGVSHTWLPGHGLLLSGENGAGKSTLILALLGLLPLSAGSIEIDGAPIDRTRARSLRQRCAYLAQSPFVEPGASVAWHLRLFSEEPISAERIDAALRRAGLFRTLQEHAARADRAHAPSLQPRDVLAGELSGGERQRMHIARILVQDAELVVLDEPEAGLDREARAEMAGLIFELSRQRRVLLIAHDPVIAPPSFDRLVIRAEPRAAEHVSDAP